MSTEDDVAAVGVGYSEQGRNLEQSSRQLAVQAARAALDDAGLGPSDVDGCTMLWGPSEAGLWGVPTSGRDTASAIDIAYMLGIESLNWFADGLVGPAFIAPAIQAVMAIKAGICHTAIALRVVRRPRTPAEVRGYGVGRPEEADLHVALAEDDRQFTMPFGSVSPTQAIGAIAAQRHMALYGTTEEQFGLHAIAKRNWAARNEDAFFREPLSLDQYLASNYVSRPLRVLDCDYPIDSASAVIFTTLDRARGCRFKPVLVEASSFSSVKYLSFENLDNILDHASHRSAKELWRRTSLTTRDVDCLQLYDGFAILAFEWLEALGFCDVGESGPFIEEGHTSIGGSIPSNTDGGAANVGRRHGANFCIETIRQLRGQEPPDRQIASAHVGLWVCGSGPFAGAMLMTSE